jgi:hypothetical protein
MKRTAEFVLGLLGGIFGVIGATFALFVGGIGAAFNAEGAGTVSGLGWAAVVFSILGIVASVMVRSRPKASGIMFLIAGIGGIISISAAYILPGVLLIIAGILSLARKEKALNK